MPETPKAITTTISSAGELVIVERRGGSTRGIVLTSQERVTLLVKLERDAARRKSAYNETHPLTRSTLDLRAARLRVEQGLVPS